MSAATHDAPLPPPARTYDGVGVEALAHHLGVARLACFDAVGSTMDVAHALAAQGAPAGTLVLADTQSVGRGRAGRRWASAPGAGVWATWLARPATADALEVLSLRVGIALAPRLDALAPDDVRPVRIKWPNDLQLAGCKLAGVLVEARWRDARPEWVAIGVGINVRTPDDVDAATGLAAHATRIDVVTALVAALREATRREDATLGAGELATFAARDAVRGRRVVAPVAGRVDGVLPTGELLVRGADGVARPLRQATLEYAD